MFVVPQLGIDDMFSSTTKVPSMRQGDGNESLLERLGSRQKFLEGKDHTDFSRWGFYTLGCLSGQLGREYHMEILVSMPRTVDMLGWAASCASDRSRDGNKAVEAMESRRKNEDLRILETWSWYFWSRDFLLHLAKT